MRSRLQGKGHGNAGFTMVELIVVMIIVALLMAIAIPVMRTAKERSKKNAMRTAAATIQAGITRFNADRPRVGATPDPLIGPAWDGNGSNQPLDENNRPYVAHWPRDPYAATPGNVRVDRVASCSGSRPPGRIMVCRSGTTPGSFRVIAWGTERGATIVVYDHTVRT